MNATITTDCSFSNLYNVGAYAFWISSNVGPFRKSGILRKKCKTSTEAEMKCILNALTFLHRQPELNLKVKTIFLNTDSMNAIHVFGNDGKKITKYELQRYVHLQKKYNDLISLLPGKEIILRHVKAHTNESSARRYVNDWADKEAKRQLGKKLEEFIIKKP